MSSRKKNRKAARSGELTAWTTIMSSHASKESRTILGCLLCSALASCMIAQGQTSVFDVGPLTIPPRGLVTVRWSLPAGEEAYITNVGLVAGQGTLDLHPTEATTFSLVRKSVGLADNHIAVIVEGIRGASDYPAEDEFTFPRHYRSRGTLPRVLKSVHEVLQNRMGYSVRETRINTETHFVTMLTPRRIGDPDFRVRERRLAYLIVVEDPNSSNSDNVIVRTLIQYQLRLENTWRPDSNSELHRSQAENFAKTLGLL